MITLENARKVREEAQAAALGRKCPTCKFYPFYLEAGSAVIEGHVYSTAGRSELGLTGMCEFCFDSLEDDEERAERTGGEIDESMIGLPLPLEGQVLQTVTNLDDYDVQSGRYDTTDRELAQVATSLVARGGPRTHKVVLDIDLPAKLVPSSTEGHYHLYIDHEIDEPVYMELLQVLGKAGILEPGYVRASQERGLTAVRLPWIKKPTPAADYATR